MRILISPCPHQYFSFFLLVLCIIVLVSMKCHLIVIFICISLIINDVEHTFHVLIGHSFYLLCRTIYSNLLPLLKLACLTLGLRIHLYFIYILIVDPNQIGDVQILSSFCGLCFHFVEMSLKAQKF